MRSDAEPDGFDYRAKGGLLCVCLQATNTFLAILATVAANRTPKQEEQQREREAEIQLRLN
jgi:hypothetical protein